MEFEKDYVAAVNHVYECVRSDDRDGWLPNIVRIEGGRKIHLIDGIEASSHGGVDDSYGNASASSMLRLIVSGGREGGSIPCALFAYNAKCGIQPVDVIVGFLDGDRNLTLAWNRKRVFPMIGANIGSTIENNQRRWIRSIAPSTFTEVPDIPADAKYIVAASLDARYRKAVAFFGRTKSLQELEKITPSLRHRAGKQSRPGEGSGYNNDLSI